MLKKKKKKFLKLNNVFSRKRWYEAEELVALAHLQRSSWPCSSNLAFLTNIQFEIFKRNEVVHHKL